MTLRLIRVAVLFAFPLCVFSVTAYPHNADAAVPSLTATGVLTWTNVERYRAGLPILHSDPKLSSVALHKMQDMFNRQYFAHEAPTGEDVSDLVQAAQYEYLSVGENLAVGDFASSREVVEAWMDSPGHRANILATKFSEIGVAAGRSTYKGRTVWMVVQTFGLPRSICPTTHHDLKDDIVILNKRLMFLEKIVQLRQKAIEEEDISLAVYVERVTSYNLAVDRYNSELKEYRTLVQKYNKGVTAYNTCLAEKTT